MRTEEQTSIHLLLAVIVSIFSAILVAVTVVFSWEMWMIPLILIGCVIVWSVHIERAGSGTLYRNFCAGLLMIEFFFFGVHQSTFYEIPAVACITILILSMLERKRLLYMTAILYVLEILYHFFWLHTITYDMEKQDMIRLGIGIAVVAGSLAIGRYRVKKRMEVRGRYKNAYIELDRVRRQNAEFLSNVSHELRTPINMVLGISEVILDKDISDEIHEDMHSILMAGKRLSNQINNMLDYAEIVEGTLTSAKEKYMITSVLNDVIATTAGQEGRNNLEIVFDIDPQMPSVLIGDAEKISHVLKILLQNSIKFTEEGGIDVCIGYRKESYGINLSIDIYDTGIGMTADQLTQMYGEFYQADSGSSRFTGGLGLGIPIARGLLNSMGGFIYFESKERQGLQAHIAIPQGVADESPAIELPNAKKICVACYFRPEKYSCDEVRGFYDKLILHLTEGFGIEGHQAHNFEGLLKIQNSHSLTHVFIAQDEYLENRNYYEELAEKLRVVVIAEREFVLDRSSRLLLIRKPFSAIAVANLLSGDFIENRFEEEQATGNRPFSCEGVRVLAVDDEEMNLVVAKGVMGSYGIEVDTCLSGKEAVERCRTNSYDMVFLDHMMPGFDGVETLRHIREIDNGACQDLPVIALTANTVSGAREMFRNEGFTEFIPKPMERLVLERVIRKVLPEECIKYEETPIEPEENLLEPQPVKEERKQEEKRRESSSQPGSVKEEKRREKKQETDSSRPAPVKEEKRQEKRQEEKREERHSQPVPVKEEKRQGKRQEKKQEERRHYTEPEKKAEEKKETQEESFTQEMPGGEGHSSKGLARTFMPLVKAGINVKMGLAYCCEEEDFYIEMLQMFCAQRGEKTGEIVALYEAANWGDYAVKVHALKSTSMTIGAGLLSEQAKALEHAGRNGDVKFIHENHSRLLHMYNEVCESIEKLLRKEA